MTKVSYLVKVNGRKGAIKVLTYPDALAKAEQVGGYIVRKYTEVDEDLTTEKSLALREKRLQYLAEGGQPPKASYH